VGQGISLDIGRQLLGEGFSKRQVFFSKGYVAREDFSQAVSRDPTFSVHLPETLQKIIRLGDIGSGV
jgi:hypothetical protein